MDDQGGNINLTLLSWRQKYRMIVVQVVCLVVYYYLIRKRSQDRMIERTLTLEKERVRAKIMKQIASSEGRKIIRMGPKAFLDLCDILKREGGLQPTQRVTLEEQVAKTLYILTHNVRNREVQFWFRRSGESTSRHLHRVQDTVGNEVTSPEVPVSRSQGPRGKRHRTSKDETEAEGIKMVLQDLVGTFRESTAAYERAKQKTPIPESEVWKMLEDLQIEDHLINRVYMYLLGHPECIRGVIGCPQDKRKRLLFEMVFGPGGPS